MVSARHIDGRKPAQRELAAERNRKLIAHYRAGHHLSECARRFGVSAGHAHGIIHGAAETRAT